MEQMKFGNYLRVLLRVNGISAVQLAEQLTCHPSVVHRWLRNENTPKINSVHVVNIVKCLNLSEDQQNCLEEAQIYSLKVPQVRTIKPKSAAGNLLKSADSRNHVLSTSFPSASHSVNILPLKGGPILQQEDAVLASIQLLEQAQSLQQNEITTIYLTFQGTQNAFESSPFYKQWKKTLRDTLQYGWDVCHLVRLDRNASRSIQLVEDMLTYLGATGSYNPYYFTHYGVILSPYDLLIIPKVGSLIFFATKQAHNIDAAIYLPYQSQNAFENQSSDVLLGHFEQLKSQTSRLLTSYSASNARSAFFDAHASIEQDPGDRYLMKDGLSDITRPSLFYREDSNWLREAYIPDEGQTKSIERWQQRLGYFYRDIETHMYRDMYPKHAIVRLVQEGKYARDYRRISPNFSLSTEERLEHLNNIIRLLKTYQNYQIGLISKSEEGDILRSFWEVKGDQGVILETWCPEDNGKEKEVVLTITEGTIAGAFQDYAIEMWEKISHRNKDKEYVIWWLEQQIRQLYE